MNESTLASLPTAFCWTRFGTEAGEPIERIVERKEAERQANGGMFFWGIGNSIAPAIDELLRSVPAPEVLFSPIKSRPRKADVSPSAVVRWTGARDLRGEWFDLPAGAWITSRWDRVRPRAHYALVCGSLAPLRLSDDGRLSFGSLRNLRSGAPLGASQVTAVVQRSDEQARVAGEYTIALRAALVPPYFIRLQAPVPVVADGAAPAMVVGAAQLQF